MTSAQTILEFDITIVGGGMVGATLACALADSGLRIALIDGNRFDAGKIPLCNPELAFDPRVSAIAPASQQVLDDVGAWKAICDSRVSEYRSMHVWDADGTGSINFAADDIGAHHLGHIVENSVILKGIYHRLDQLPQVELFAPARVVKLERLFEQDRQRIKLVTEDGQTFVTTLLVGADGPNSKVRQLANFTTREWDYQHQAIVTTVRTELPHQGRALQRFMETGPLAFLPLQDHSVDKDSHAATNQHYSSIVWSLVPERAEQLLAMTDEGFSRTLGDSIEHKLGEILWVDKRFAFPLRQRHAVDYVQENIALVGDAAHTIHPLAGQGVNLGFQDVKALSEEISANLARQRPLDEFAMLRRYQRQRIGHNLGMMWLMEGFKFLFAEQALPLRWLRNAGMSGVDQMSVVKNKLMRQAMGNLP